MSKRRRRKEKIPTYVEYKIRVPIFVDDLLTLVVTETNKKKPDPKDKLNNEALVNILIRDWYINQVIPKVTKEAADNAARQESLKIIKAYQEVFKRK